MHPLLNSLKDMSDDDLYNKLNELNKRYMQAYRFGPHEIIPQVQMLIEDYNAEINKRNAQKMKDLQEKLDRQANKKDGKGMKGIIDIQ